MKIKSLCALAVSLLFIVSAASASVVTLNEVTVKAGGYNSISLENLKPKYVYDIDCTVTNIHYAADLSIGVEQRYSTPSTILLNDKPLVKNNDASFYQAKLTDVKNKLHIAGVTNRSGTFAGDYLYFYNDAAEGTTADYKISSCTASTVGH